MAKAKTSMVQDFARIGAAARIQQLQSEIAEIERAFPGISKTRSTKPSPAPADGPKPAKRARRKMTAAQRKAVGERMKKYWAARRKTKERPS